MAAVDATVADQEEDSADGSEAETRNPRSRMNTKASKPAARTRGAQPPMVRGGGSHPVADIAEDSAQSGSVFDRLGALPREPARRAPA